MLSISWLPGLLVGVFMSRLEACPYPAHLAVEPNIEVWMQPTDLNVRLRPSPFAKYG